MFILKSNIIAKISELEKIINNDKIIYRKLNKGNDIHIDLMETMSIEEKKTIVLGSIFSNERALYVLKELL